MSDAIILVPMQAREVLNESLLHLLELERRKHGAADLDYMQRLCDELVKRGVYPSTSGIGYTPLKMVEAWGVRWHEYAQPHNCPLCNADLCNRETGTPFKREIVVTDRNRNEVDHLQCPDCKQVIEKRI